MLLANFPRFRAALDVALIAIDEPASDPSLIIPNEALDRTRAAELELLIIDDDDVIALVRPAQAKDARYARALALAPTLDGLLSEALWWDETAERRLH